MASCPATLNGLPSELKTYIVEYLHEPGPLSNGSRLCEDYFDPDFRSDRRPRWNKLSIASRQDILNIRQVSPDFRAASWKSFGRLISDLHFRVVPADIADLGKISEIPQLTPWIKALTFGTGGFEDSRLCQDIPTSEAGSLIPGKKFIQSMSAYLQDENLRSELEKIVS
ncbi:uncharacterized protein BDZ99DRAFT_517332 [Mytilinidion resinicola]|uniref:F-box domain-containing protein n=1 Tax=Mytilinidion resinicola TaxID=574789 RepID=A0A6A6YVS0_9PEZI|nr:uncharacterized protein BDZ99DRAFT_517332 [Mytilinidion resinicola]KAF2813042.1 hypothetical protein BDZ99DRAFT_517332 [Mytilinidion resinicola]